MCRDGDAVGLKHGISLSHNKKDSCPGKLLKPVAELVWANIFAMFAIEILEFITSA